MSWKIVGREIGFPLDGFTFNGGKEFRYPTNASLTIGAPGSSDFAVGKNVLSNELYFEVLHVASLSVFNDIPSTSPIVVQDPFADPTASGFTLDGNAFPISVAGYSIGTAGDTNFAIATDLDTATSIIDPVHTASLSIM